MTSSSVSRKTSAALFAASLVLMTGPLRAQIPLADPPAPLASLKTVPIPGPTDAELAVFIQNKAAAIRLGKALFWDMQVGSDGVTGCASCHFHAGADSRVKNQLSPGLKAGDTTFQSTFLSPVTGPNFTLQTGDFPINSNDVVSSQGVHNRSFVDIITGSAVDECSTVPDPDGFHVGGINTRKVEPRNTPSMINAVFNFRNFWDGRANNDFNGANPFGLRDRLPAIPPATIGEPTPHVWLQENIVGPPAQVAVSELGGLQLSSLASQAVGPPLSDFEMSCKGRTFAKLGQKMLSLTPLAKQKVHVSDSVLGGLAKSQLHPSFKGLQVSYEQLIKDAFHPQYWRSTDMVTVNGSQHTQMEANFALFFGLAVQLYEATLIADDTPLDRHFEGVAPLNPQQQGGAALFEGKGRCSECHGGAELTNASVVNVMGERLERMVMGDGGCAIYDNGFYNIGVRPTLEDIGLGGLDPFGNPLSETRMAMLGTPVGPTTLEPELFILGGLGVPECDSRANVDGTFKVPGLRNVELTGPYFHNGGHATLREVIDFYNAGGIFAQENIANLDIDIAPIGFTEQEKQDLEAFLKALTDERVRFEKKPFDHPELCVPNGHLGDHLGVVDDGAGNAVDDDAHCIPAVGAAGAAEPLKSFVEMAATGGAPGTLPPTAGDDAATTEKNVPVTIAVTANDKDIDGAINPATVAPLVQPLHGALAVNPATGVVTYTPHTDFTGTDSFTYTVQDNLGADSNEAIVTLTVNAPVPSGGIGSSDNPDTLKITKARLNRDNGLLRVEGRVRKDPDTRTFAASVDIHAGGVSSAGACSGAIIADNWPVKQRGLNKGKFTLRTTSSSFSSLTEICVKSLNGGVASRRLRIR